MDNFYFYLDKMNYSVLVLEPGSIFDAGVSQLLIVI